MIFSLHVFLLLLNKILIFDSEDIVTLINRNAKAIAGLLSRLLRAQSIHIDCINRLTSSHKEAIFLEAAKA